MAPRNKYRPFAPDPEQQALWPDLSGNAVNGLNEKQPRSARMVYWAPDPSDIPHGQLQMYFYKQSAKVPEFAVARARRQEILDVNLPQKADAPTLRSGAAWTSALSEFVEAGICELTGVAEMRKEWVLEGHQITQSRVIMLGVQHEYDSISKAPEPEAGLEVMAQYTRAAAAAKEVAGWLRKEGWDAEALTGPMAGPLLMIPPALACGFGELGKHGSVINPDIGSSFRLAAVLTDAPFGPTAPVEAGIDGFCANCRICEDACPPEAIFHEKQTVRGTKKWYVNFDKCLPFFNQTHGCAICIAVCPWSRPGVGPNLAAKLARRAARLDAET